MRRTVGKPQAGDEASASEARHATQIVAGDLLTQHGSIRRQLDILRQTRAQRQVGTLAAPAHLRSAIELTDRDVEVLDRDTLERR